MDLDLKIESVKPERTELFNFKNNDDQIKFKQLTSETSEFSQCFENNLNLFEQIANWQNVLNSYCSKAFKKIRIKNKNVIPINKQISELIS